MACCGSRPSPDSHVNATRLEVGIPAVQFWEVHLDGCVVHQRWGTLAVEHTFKQLTPQMQYRASRSERPRCRKTKCRTKEEAEALRAKLIAAKKKRLYVEAPVDIPCPPPPQSWLYARSAAPRPLSL